MTSISGFSASLASAQLDVARPLPQPPKPDASNDAPRYEGGQPNVRYDSGMTDCWPIDPRDLSSPDGDRDIFEPRDPGDYIIEAGVDGEVHGRADGELYVDENGQLGWRTVVQATGGDDTIHVTYNLDGSADVDINGETTHYTAEQARNMRISGGAGDDTITVTDNRFFPRGDVTVQGSSGDDNVSGDLGKVDVDGGTGLDVINGWPEGLRPITPENPFPPIPMPQPLPVPYGLAEA